jgi:hypothetical protein
MKFADIKPIPGYEDLERVLCAAYLQAAVGKGAERHADAKPFTEQPMQTIAKSYGTVDGMMFQVSKKLGESRGLPEGRAQAEVLGAIVYSAGVHIAYDTWAKRGALNTTPEAVKPTDKDGWTNWHGDECPVDPNVVVDIGFRNGIVNKSVMAGEWAWGHSADGDEDFEIIKYRVVR